MVARLRTFALCAGVLLVCFLAGCSAGTSISISNPGGITVALSPSQPQSIVMGQTVNITAAVTGASSNAGVTWSLSGAGSLVNPTSTSVTYQAPASVSMPEAATITATASADMTRTASLGITVNVGNAACDSGSESKLNGSYAFLFQGFNSQGYVAIAGQFTADGSGKITAGQEDVTTARSTTGTNPIQLNAANSSYSLGADNRGCLTLASSSGTIVFRFSAASSNGAVFTKGRLVEFDDSSVTGQRGAGILRLQDPSAFSTSTFTGNFVFGGSGVNSSAQRFGIAGVADLSSGIVTGGEADADDGGTPINQALAAGNYTIDSSGRGTLTFAFGASTVNFGFYVVSRSEAIVLTTDALTASNPIAAGLAELQTGTFSSSSLSGNIVLHDTALSSSGPVVVLGLLSADGATNISGPTFNNAAGTSGTSTLTETYTVASDGRISLVGGAHPAVFYLYGTNEGFEVGTGPDSSFGFLENQSAGPFTNSSINGTYALGSEDPSDSVIQMASGEIVGNGSAGSPALSGTIDESGPLGLTPGAPFDSSYTVGANGVGSISVNGAPTTNTLIVISPTKVVFFENGNQNPVISVLEQ